MMVFLHFDVTAVVTFHTLIFNMISNIFHFIFKAYKAFGGEKFMEPHIVLSMCFRNVGKVKILKINIISNNNICNCYA